MNPHERKDWRTCGNCVHNRVCKFRDKEENPCCADHIYNADPKRYGDLQELIEPVCEWMRNHYPSEGKLTVDKYSAQLEIPIHGVYSYEYIPEPPKGGADECYRNEHKCKHGETLCDKKRSEVITHG